MGVPPNRLLPETPVEMLLKLTGWPKGWLLRPLEVGPNMLKAPLKSGTPPPMLDPPTPVVLIAISNPFRPIPNPDGTADQQHKADIVRPQGEIDGHPTCWS